MNKVCLVGRIANDPNLSDSVESLRCQMSIAVKRPFKNKKGEYDTDFIFCEAWGKTAQIVEAYINKGDLVSIEGSMRVNKYVTNEGDTRYNTFISVDKIHVLLKSGEKTAVKTM